jgi:SAM-dependent methyltransferase
MVDESVRVYWEKNYDGPPKMNPSQNHVITTDFLKEMKPPFESALSGSSSILEFGCARGEASRMFVDRFGTSRVLATEISQNAIDQAIQERAHANIDFRVVDVLEDDLGGEKFDLIYCSNTLEHFSNPVKTMGQLFSFAPRAIILVPYKQSKKEDSFGDGGSGHCSNFDEKTFSDKFEVESWFTFRTGGWSCTFSEYQIALLIRGVR